MPYSGDPSTSPNDELRFILGDTDPNNPLFTDEEIQYMLDTAGSVYGAALLGCNSLIARYAGEVSRTIGSLSVSASDKMKHYITLRDTIKSGAARAALPYAGGISKSDKLAREEDTDRVQPFFTRDGL